MFGYLMAEVLFALMSGGEDSTLDREKVNFYCMWMLIVAVVLFFS